MKLAKSKSEKSKLTKSEFSRSSTGKGKGKGKGKGNGKGTMIGPTSQPETDAPTPQPLSPSPPFPPDNTEPPTPTPSESQPTSPTEMPTAVPGPPEDEPTLAPIDDDPTAVPVEGPTVLPTPSVDVPTQPPGEDTEVPESTEPPTAETPSTRPPVPDNGVETTPFSIAYELEAGFPTQEEYDQAAQVTLQYLEEYLTEQFEFNLATDFERLDGAAIDFSDSEVIIEYIATAVFGPSEELPDQESLDVLIASAFEQPSVQTLLTALRTLTNVFETTQSVIYTETTVPLPTPIKNPPETRDGATSPDSSRSGVVIGTAIAGAVVVLLVAGYAFFSRKSQNSQADQYGPAVMPNGSNIMSFMDGGIAGGNRSVVSSRSADSRAVSFQSSNSMRMQI